MGKFRYFVLTIVGLLAACLLFLPGNGSVVGERESQPVGDLEVGLWTPDTRVEQTFIATAHRLHRIDFRVDSYHPWSSPYLDCRLFEIDTEQSPFELTYKSIQDRAREIRYTRINGWAISWHMFNSFSFAPIPQSKDKRYLLSIQSPGLKKGGGSILLASSGDEYLYYGNLFVDGERKQGDLAFRALYLRPRSQILRKSVQRLALYKPFPFSTPATLYGIVFLYGLLLFSFFYALARQGSVNENADNTQRILLLTNELNSFDGWATVGYELGKYLVKTADVIAVTNQHAGNDTITPQIFPVLDENRYITLKSLRLLFTKNIRHIDIVLCNIERCLPLAILLKLRFHSKLIVIGHGTYIYRPFATTRKRKFAGLLLRFVDLVLVPSHYTCKKVREFYYGKIEILQWGVDSTRYFPIDGIQKEQAFLFVGELKERKGISYLLQAFAKLAKDFPSMSLYLAGKSNGTYDRLIQELHIADNVKILGQIPHQELLEYYSKAIAHLLPSVNTEWAFEGFGLVHLEANACKVPTIGSLDCGNEDAILDGKTGFLCPQKDVDALYQKMALLATDASLREQLSQQALEHAKKHSWNYVGQQFLAFVTSLDGKEENNGGSNIQDRNAEECENEIL
ncbi:MAG: glycosyltransferase family 4 protein [bacterium]|nr:glycosyltransferase family 4 protein [bacterium]